MYVVRCDFFDLNMHTNDALFANALNWVKNNQDVFIANVIGVPVMFNGLEVGHVLSACLKEKKFVAVFNNRLCNLNIKNVSPYCVIQTQGPQQYTCEFFAHDETSPNEPSFKDHLYDNQYKFLFNRELGEEIKK